MSDRQIPPLAQLPLDTLRTMTPRQVHDHVALIVGKAIAEYHRVYHTPWWKQVALRVAAEVQSFKMVVNEQYGAMHEREELYWQRAARSIRDLRARLSRGIREAEADAAKLEREAEEALRDAAQEGTSAIRFTEGRAAKKS